MGKSPVGSAALSALILSLVLRILAIASATLCCSPAFAQVRPAEGVHPFEGIASSDLPSVQFALKYTPLVMRESPAFVFVVGEARPALGTSSWPPPEVTRVTPEEMKELLDSVVSCVAVRSPTMSADTSFAVELSARIRANDRHYRVPLDEDEMADLWGKLWRSVAPPTDARAALAGFGQGYGLARGPAPKDQMDKVRLDYSGFRPIGMTSEYVGLVTVTNVSRARLAAPVSLVLWPWISGVEISWPKPSGFTVLSGPWPRPYFDLPVGESFDPGESVQVRVHLRNASHQSVELRAMLFAGGGDR
jgi:hypothetical protein